MNRSLALLTLTTAVFGLAACNPPAPAVVTVPTPAPAPGPAGPAGPPGDPGKPGGTAVIVVEPAASAPNK